MGVYISESVFFDQILNAISCGEKDCNADDRKKVLLGRGLKDDHMTGNQEDEYLDDGSGIGF